MRRIIDCSPDLILFTYLVDYQSFTALADRLEMNKSLISKRIKNLENTLGTQLLIRTTRSLRLTEAGELLYNRCRGMQDDFHSLYNEISDLTTAAQGTLRVSAPSGFAQEHLVPLFAEFSRRYPDIKCKLMTGRSYQSMIKHRIDLGFHMGSLDDSTLVARKLASRKSVVCATPDYFKKHGAPTTPDELLQYNCLLFMQGKHLSQWEFVAEDGEVLSVAVTGNFHATSTQLLKSAALNHVGIIMLPEYLVTQELKAHQLQAVLREYDTRHVDIYALYAQTRHLPRRARLLLDFAVERFNSDHYWS
jgi:DNA-binding transcriptional LysR family regulator